MARRTRFNVVPAKDGWAVTQGGQKRPLASVGTKERAVEIARGLAKEGNGEVSVRGKEGRIQSPYSLDPQPPKGSGWTRSRDPRTGSFTTPRSAERIRSTSVRAADVLKRLAKR
jgi:hypothetical protein